MNNTEEILIRVDGQPNPEEAKENNLATEPDVPTQVIREIIWRCKLNTTGECTVCLSEYE